MDEKLMKLMEMLGLLAVIVWVVASATGNRAEAAVYVPVAPAPLPRARGDVWARGCIAAPYAQGTFQPGLYMGTENYIA